MRELNVIKANQDCRASPKYIRYNCWDITGEKSPSVVDWSSNLSLAKPLPSPPSLNDDHPVRATVESHPDLFKIVSPINLSSLRYHLYIHPNVDLVESVYRGFENGFWPWAVVDKEGFPVTHDQRRSMPSDPVKAEVLREHCKEEIKKERFSHSFGTDLLPGMYASPTFPVPKKGSNKLRLVTDQSIGRFPVNDLTIPHDRSFPLDNMVHLGELILRLHKTLNEGEHLVLFKSDVSEAYRLIPMHPYWQIKQVNTVDGQRYIDRNNVFGGRRSGDLFICFMSLVLWIAQEEYKVKDLLAYCDDAFSADKNENMDRYEPYDMLMPSKQATLLRCWDNLGIPHKKEKQLWGNLSYHHRIRGRYNQTYYNTSKGEKG